MSGRRQRTPLRGGAYLRSERSSATTKNTTVIVLVLWVSCVVVLIVLVDLRPHTCAAFAGLADNDVGAANLLCCVQQSWPRCHRCGSARTGAVLHQLRGSMARRAAGSTHADNQDARGNEEAFLRDEVGQGEVLQERQVAPGAVQEPEADAAVGQDQLLGGAAGKDDQNHPGQVMLHSDKNKSPCTGNCSLRGGNR